MWLCVCLSPAFVFFDVSCSFGASVEVTWAHVLVSGALAVVARASGLSTAFTATASVVGVPCTVGSALAMVLMAGTPVFYLVFLWWNGLNE